MVGSIEGDETVDGFTDNFHSERRAVMKYIKWSQISVGNGKSGSVEIPGVGQVFVNDADLELADDLGGDPWVTLRPSTVWDFDDLAAGLSHYAIDDFFLHHPQHQVADVGGDDI